MRSEEEMIGLILKFAVDHDDVRAAIMNGSRVNPNVPKDLFQDYDIVYLVRDVAPYRRNHEIVSYFGDIMILQTPEDMGDSPPKDDGVYAYLMQFLDGNRIDLTFFSIKDVQQCVEDTLSVVLLDKDYLFGQLPPPSDHGYLAQKPTAKSFDECCNEFWWLAPYVAKGLWRDELTYAKYMLDTLMREQLMKMLTWYLGTKTDFRRSPGKLGKYLKGQIDDDLWTLLERTYSDSLLESSWQSLFAMGDLFRRAAQPVAVSFGFTYPEQDDRHVSDYIRRIQSLPRNAKSL